MIWKIPVSTNHTKLISLRLHLSFAELNASLYTWSHLQTLISRGPSFWTRFSQSNSQRFPCHGWEWAWAISLFVQVKWLTFFELSTFPEEKDKRTTFWKIFEVMPQKKIAIDISIENDKLFTFSYRIMHGIFHRYPKNTSSTATTEFMHSFVASCHVLRR